VGWGGGTTLAEIDLDVGRDALLRCYRNAENLERIRRSAIIPVIETLPALTGMKKRYQVDSKYRREYKRAEELFLAEVERITQGDMVQSSLTTLESFYRATLKHCRERM